MKQLLDQASEKAQQIEDAKLSAVGMRNLVSAEIETRPEKLRHQASLIADKQERLEVHACDEAYQSNCYLGFSFVYSCLAQ